MLGSYCHLKTKPQIITFHKFHECIGCWTQLVKENYAKKYVYTIGG